MGHSTPMSTRKVKIPLSILLLAAIGAKLIGPHGGLKVDKEAVTEVTRSVDLPISIFFQCFKFTHRIGIILKIDTTRYDLIHNSI